jgi:hypothetical protein
MAIKEFNFLTPMQCLKELLMKKLLLLTLAACLSFSMALAQDPANFRLVYGNSDGSVIAAGLDRDIEIQAWGATSAGPGDLQDSVTFMHNPLSSNNDIITARLGGFFPPAPGVGGWDDRSFLNPETDSCHYPGPPLYTNQSMLGFAWLTDPRSEENFFYTLGALQLILTYRMHTTADPAYINQTVCPFVEGCNPANGGVTWGMSDGIRGVAPIQSFPCIFFSPNADPEWVSGSAQEIPIGGGCFFLEGTDSDLENNLHITFAGPGTFTETAGGPGGYAAGNWCGDVADGTVLNFILDDGTVQVPLDVVVTLNCREITAATLGMTCPQAAPGGPADVYVTLQSNGCVGGFEILIQTDPTVLDLVSVTPQAAINNGSEYFNHVPNPFGVGTDRFVWVADINNGVPGIPMGWNSAAENVMKLTFNVAPGLPWGMNIPIYFHYTDYTDNTISDQTGYNFFHPVLVDGCVTTANPEIFAGDPNMNCFEFEIADAVLVAQRLIQGMVVWPTDDFFANVPPCDRHFSGNDPLQEAACDLNGNGFADIADLVRFINIINGFSFPKLDPVSGEAVISIGNGAVSINSGVEIGGVLVKIQGEISQVQANGMDVLTHNVDGVTSVVIYSLEGNRVPAGRATLFTFQGEGTIIEASAADAYGRLIDATARQEAPIPTAFTVKPNYPNPFNAKTLINFDLPSESDVTVSIYNITGQVVETINQHFQPGYISVSWDANAYASGIYFAKVAFGSETQTVKMTLLK